METCKVVEVDGGVDHRTLGHGGARPRWCSGAWLTRGSAAQLAAVSLALPDPAHRRQLQVGGRPMWVLGADASGGDDVDPTVHLRFSELCQHPTSVADLLELTECYRTVAIAGVPAVAAADEDAWRRFANLVDICWDRDVRLVALADIEPACVTDVPVTDAVRMLSRLSLLRNA